MGRCGGDMEMSARRARVKSARTEHAVVAFPSLSRGPPFPPPPPRAPPMHASSAGMPSGWCARPGPADGRLRFIRELIIDGQTQSHSYWYSQSPSPSPSYSYVITNGFEKKNVTLVRKHEKNFEIII